MIQCDSCDKWLDLQSDAVALDEGTLCPECATEWYGDSFLKLVAEHDLMNMSDKAMELANAEYVRRTLEALEKCN